MYNRRRRKRTQTELHFVEFEGALKTRLRADNRWVKLAKLIPWDRFEQEYASNFTEHGNEALPFRVALGALIVKEQLGLSDRDVVLAIEENPYIQYFLGYTTFLTDAPFDASLMVHFRKRISKELLLRMNEHVAQAHVTASPGKSADTGDDEDPPPQGKLIIDATCAPEDMKYPTDVGLLNDSREITEQVIDVLWAHLSGEKAPGRKKPRTYRIKARRAFLGFIRRKKPSRGVIRKSIRKQLGFVARNMNTVRSLVVEGASLSHLDAVLYRKLLVASEVLRQQQELFDRQGTHDRHVADRIVSLAKPHVRPIVRGKAAAPVEFGAKISASAINGMVFLDRHSWDAYNECADLVAQAERFKARTGRYPASIHADKIYRTRDNHRWCKERNIRLSGPPLGRPIADETLRREQYKIQRQDELDRIAIEGMFGVAKRRFSLGKIMTKLRETSEHSVALLFMLMNLNKILRDFLSLLFVSAIWRYVKERLGSKSAIVCC